MITADQIIVHAIGDYLLQSDWMASEKTKRHAPAFAHALVYSLPFLIFAPSLAAFAVILGTHFLIDRYRLARYVVWAKNFLAPKWIPFCNYGCHRITDAFALKCGSCRSVRNMPWRDCRGTGYPSDRPAWLAVWLLIFADNILHVVINGLALRYL